MPHFETDIIIVGAGPVGLFTIFQCGMLGMKCHVVDSLPEIGGQCTALYPEKPIYDIPARPVINGGDLIADLEKQAEPFHPTYHLDQQVVGLNRDEDTDTWTITTSKDTTITAKAVIIAAGSGAFGPNRPPLDNLAEFENKSVFYMVRKKDDFKNKNVVIAGGGDSAVDWAVALYGIANHVYVIHRRDKFRAAQATVDMMQEIATEHPENMTILTPYQIKSLHGTNGDINTVTIATLEGDVKDIKADTLLAFYGLVPSLGPIAEWGLNLDGHTITVDQSTCETSVKGIYAVGDMASYPHKLKLILTGFAESASAAHHAYNRVYPDKALHFEYSTSKGVAEI